MPNERGRNAILSKLKAEYAAEQGANKTRDMREEAEKTLTEGEIPNTVKNQNLGHNSKKEGLGPSPKPHLTDMWNQSTIFLWIST